MIGCRYPIMLGAFGGYDNKELTAAISQAGGFGILTAGSYKNVSEFRMAIKFVKKKTANPFGINFSVDNDVKIGHPFYKFLNIAEEEGIKTVISAAYKAENLGRKIKEKDMNWIHKACCVS